MNELLETERAYVEELLCVLQVLIYTTENILGFIFSFFCICVNNCIFFFLLL